MKTSQDVLKGYLEKNRVFRFKKIVKYICAYTVQTTNKSLNSSYCHPGQSSYTKVFGPNVFSSFILSFNKHFFYQVKTIKTLPN